MATFCEGDHRHCPVAGGVLARVHGGSFSGAEKGASFLRTSEGLFGKSYIGDYMHSSLSKTMTFYTSFWEINVLLFFFEKTKVFAILL